MERGLIIVLNGTSSSGKTSMSNSLVNQSGMVFLHLSLDEFATGMFKSYTEWLNSKFTKLNEIVGEREQQKIAGAVTEPIISMYNSTIKTFSELGVNVIVDHVVGIDKRWLLECIKLFDGYPVIFVGLKCSLEELESREKLRGDRHIGLAKLQFEKIHTHIEYDIEMNTEHLSSEECARFLKEFLQSKLEFKAFNKLKLLN